MKVSRTKRNVWLLLDDEALLKQCREDRYKSGGPGGQRRNKVETAVKLHHEASGASVHSNDSRYLERNRLTAVRRLRERIALNVRAPFDLDAPELPDEFIKQRGSRGTLGVNEKNPVYPIIVATALDALQATGGSYARTAAALGITTSQLVKFLKSDREIQRALS
ncbi:MAG: peptide chain release factor-like protein [Chloroflexi bacterium]|nr:peptide chain release factor-like protein [Chloroflexota bacterium]